MNTRYGNRFNKYCQMRSFLADIFKLVFTLSFFRKRFYGIHERLIHPFNLFKGVKKRCYHKNILFDLYIDDWIQENLFFLGEYEAPELSFLEDTLKEGDVFIDIGANIGLYTLLASTLVGENGKVISFEPFAYNFNRLKHNVAQNFNKNIVLEKLAVSEKKEKITIAYDAKEANRGMASAYLTDFSYSETTDSTSIDGYFRENSLNKVNFIKIDIEGGEFPALLGMRETLNKYGPVILIEINKEVLARTPYTERAIIEYLNQLGYKQYNWNNDPQSLHISTNNFVFKRNSI